MISEVAAHPPPSQPAATSKSSTRATRPPPPPLPVQRSLEIPGAAIVQYIDVQPPQYTPATTPTIVLMHGSPGSYKDFRYIVPLLQPYARVVALTLPGFDGSTITDDANRFDHVSAQGSALLALDALTQICSDVQHMFLIGHSFGGHSVTNIAALNLDRKQLAIKGIGFFASAGHRPHRTLWPWTISVLATLIQSRIPLVAPAAESLSHSIYTKFVGFPDNGLTHHYASSVVRVATTDFDVVNEQRKAIAHIPAFVAWARDDVHIEEEISLTLSDASHAGPRFGFDKGGHNIQKTQAATLAPALTTWMDEIVASSYTEM